ncbi:MAG TPA: LUD domain-containing protein [Bacteroidales bacterium]|nr:LUD domain-containing protein [Bacteroidales bacterium]HNS47479.1 LUD domain-containing protein [Bacteroidales bacterium]
MEESTSKEKVLKKIRNALLSGTEVPYPGTDAELPLFHKPGESLDVVFAQAFTRAGGMFVFCENEKELVSSLQVILEDLPDGDLFCQEQTIGAYLVKAGIPFCSGSRDLEASKVSVTGCEALVAHPGSIVVSSAQTEGRKICIFPDSQIVIGFSSQLTRDLQQALSYLNRKYEPDYPSLISVITGPSRTADIEKTLVMGAHGPRNLYLFYVDRTEN